VNKIIFLSLFSFALTINSYFEIIDQTNDKITINFNLQDYEIKNNQLGNIFVIPGAGTRSLEGEPSLPSLSSFVLLDKNANYDINYTVVSEDELSNIYIAPQQSFNKNNVNIIKNENIYSISHANSKINYEKMTLEELQKEVVNKGIKLDKRNGKKTLISLLLKS